MVDIEKQSSKQTCATCSQWLIDVDWLFMLVVDSDIQGILYDRVCFLEQKLPE